MTFWGDSGGFLNEDEDDIEAENQSSTQQWETGRDGLIFLIDTTKPMFTPAQNGSETPFEICVKCARNVLMSKIISSDKDLIGMIFYGTEETKNSSDFKHVYVMQDLDLPDAERILQLETLVMEDRLKKFAGVYGHSDQFSLSDALWSCSNMFANSTYKLAQKRILLFTSTDDPHSNSPDNRRRALKKAKDLSDLGIELELLHMKLGFNVDRFYRDIVSDDTYQQMGDPSEKFDELLTRVRMKEFKKRTVTRLPVNLSDDISFSVGAYLLNSQAKKGTYVKVDARSNNEVKASTKYICQDTGQELLPTDIKAYKDFGGAKVIYESEEVKQMKSFLKPGFHLLGFKPKSSLKIHHHVKPAWFLYPDETTISGSTPLFTALLKRCLARDVVSICVLVARQSAAPRFVALLPQKEEFDENHLQTKAPGFHAIYLPFSDDIRKLKLESHTRASEEQIDKAKDIIDKLKFNYTPEKFENPSIQKFYRCLEAFALDRDEVEEFTDLTMPNNDLIDKQAGNVIQEFKELVFPDNYNPSSSGTKRKATSSTTSAGGAKKTKVGHVDLDMEATARNGTLNKCTVAILKGFCQANKIKTASQKKADLISAVKQHFGV